MVSAYRTDALRDPTLELRDLFASSSSLEEDDFAAQVTRHFSHVFSADDAFAEIPSLDTRRPPEAHRDRALVRFRAMVQDTSASSEMYLRRTRSGALGGWGVHDADEDDGGGMEANYAELRECRVLWAVSVPGESAWCADELGGPSEDSVHVHVPLRSHKHPDPTQPHLGVQVKLYDRDAADTLQSTDLVTFVGILSYEPLDMEDAPPVDVPTLHVLFTRAHPPPLLARPFPAPPPSVRDALIAWIAEEALGGDTDAAEWVLLASIAQVYVPPIHTRHIWTGSWSEPAPGTRR